MAELGCPCCGLTDHGVISGHLEFDKVLRAKGIKPIFGCELYHGTKTEFAKNERDQFHLVAGAITDEGLKNLWRLVDKAATFYRYVGRVNFDMLSQFNEGLFITSACIQGLVPRQAMQGDYDALNRYLDIFGDRFFIELHTYPGEEHEALNLRLWEIAQERGVGVVYATDAHKAWKHQYETHDAYLMFKGENIDTPVEERKMWHPENSLYIMDEQEIREALSYLPQTCVDEAISNSVEIGNMVDAHLPDIVDHRPVFIPKDCPWIKTELSSPELLVDLVQKGIQERYGDNPEAEARAVEELEVFLDANLADYFLMTWDMIQYCKDKKIQVGPGRGSAAGCIVAYALGITDVDPLKYGLIFERFYNAGRAGGLPDIDSDFPREARRPIIDYLSDRWGANRVRVIGNVSRMTPKAALDRFWGALKVTYDEKEELKRLIIAGIPDLEILDYKQFGWNRELDPGKLNYIDEILKDEIEAWVKEQGKDREPYLRRWLTLLATVCNRVSNYGIHASGVVISDVDLDDQLPARWVPDHKLFVTQFPMIDVDARKFMKQDILGLRTLDTLADWVAQIKEKYGFEIEWSGLENEEGDNQAVWEMIGKGQVRGIFQLEKGQQVHLCKEMKPESIEDLAVIGSIIRPGPNMYIKTYLARRNGSEEVTYDDPILEDILAPTLGIFLYQEQVINYFNKIGYTLIESDDVRRILGKKQPVDLQRLKDGEGKWKGRGYFDVADPVLGHQQASKIWDSVEAFAKYSFNKSHAICYGLTGWRTAFAKSLGTSEYLMACIRTNEKKKGQYVAEGRRMGVDVLPPDVRLSEPDISIQDGNIIFGLANVKGVGKPAARLVIEMRDRGMNVLSPEAINESLDILDDEWKEQRDLLAEAGKPLRVLSPRTRLKRNQVDALYYAGAFNNYIETEFSLQERQGYEKELLDIILSDNTVKVFEDNFDLLENCDEYLELETAEDGQSLILPGIISSIRETKTRKKPHHSMGIVSIEFESDEVEFVVFPQQWKAYKFLWHERTPGIFTLKKTTRGINFQEGIKLS